MAYQFKIQLKNISNPTVWRRVLVPDNFTLHELHNTIQQLFPWGNSHMYQFSPSGFGSYPVISLLDMESEDENEEMDSTETKLSDIFKTEKQTYTYIYDFGDDWNHKIIFEKIVPETIPNPKCIKGKGKCPPDDCGGIWGYQELLDVISDPKDEEYTNVREWLGLKNNQVWDVNEFDLDQINERLERSFE